MSVKRLHTVHYIDDSPDEFLITRLLFRRAKIDVELKTYPDFADFINSVQTEVGFEPAETLVISDLNLAVSSGLQAVRTLRSDPAMAGAFVGICSGSDDPADQKAALEAGADFFVTKPLDKTALAAMCDMVANLFFVRRDDDTHHLMLSSRI